MFGPGLPEIAIAAFVVLLLFGNRLPSLMRSMGRSVVEFKKGVQGIEETAEAGTPMNQNQDKHTT